MSASQERLFSIRTLQCYRPLTEAPVTLPQAVRPARPLSSGQRASQLDSAKPTAADDASWVKTAEDVLSYFDKWGADAQVQFFYCVKGVVNVNSSTGADASPDRCAAEFFLRVVPPAYTIHLPSYYIVSQRQLIKVDRRSQEPTDSVPLAEWVAHKKVYLRLRQLTFYRSFALAKCFKRWRDNYHRRVFRRRQQQVQDALFPTCPAFQGALLEAARLLEGLRSVRAAGVQPGRLYSTDDWLDQQETWRSRKVQPEVETIVTALARLAEGVCTQVEATAEHMLGSVKAHELQDKIGVNLCAATTTAKAPSMQRIKREKKARALAYHRALLERAKLPRFLRLLDMRLADALAGMAVSTATDVALTLRDATPELLLKTPAGGVEGEAQDGCEGQRGIIDGEVPAASAKAQGTAGNGALSPAFLCNLVVDANGSIGFSSGESDWTAAVEGEVVASTLRLAGGVQLLLSLPAFERYQAQMTAEEGATEEAHIQQPAGAEELARQDSVFVDAVADLASMLKDSYSRAWQLAQRYQQYLAIHQFGLTWKFEDWAAQQREAIDLAGAEATLHQLCAWRRELETMPLSHNAGLLHLDASPLQASLQPVVSKAHDCIIGLLLQLSGEQCLSLLSELSKWEEVAGARPTDLEWGFLHWAAELSLMQKELEGQLAAAAAVNAALEVVEAYGGRLPTAEAVKKDDLQEAVRTLPATLEAAVAWQVEQRVVHAAAVEQQAQMVAEDATQLEGELKMGIYVDVGSASAEMLADLELQSARLEAAVARVQALAHLQQELGLKIEGGQQVRAAEVALQRCVGLWTLVCEAEELQASLAAASCADYMEREVLPDPPTPEQARRQLAELQDRLAALQGARAELDVVWLRASNAVVACTGLLAE